MNQTPTKKKQATLEQTDPGLSKLKVVSHHRVSDEVLVSLTNLIIEGDFAPGSKLPTERDLAQRFGVNRASLREALRRLENMGMVYILQGGGIYIQDYMAHAGLEFISYLLQNGIHLDKRLILEMAEMRILVGKSIISLAAQRMTPEILINLEVIVDRIAGANAAQRADGQLDFAFYYELAKTSGNRIFVFMLNTVRDVMLRVIGMYFQVADNSNTSIDLYRGLLDALRQGDGKKASEIFEKQARQDDLLLSGMVNKMG